MRTLYWFRSDLRVADNRALCEAIKASDQLIAVYCLTPETWQSHNAAPRKIQFLLENLKSLSQSLWKFGIPLLIRNTHSYKAIPDFLHALCAEHEIDAVFWTEEYLLDEVLRDQAVKHQLSAHVEIQTYHQQCIIEPGQLLTQQGTPFRVFTPFKKAWLARAQIESRWQVASIPKKKFVSMLKPDVVPEVLDGFELDKNIDAWQVGEQGAHAQLQAFCDAALSNYAKCRDIPAINGTSNLSAYLAQGVISPRQCITAGLSAVETLSLENVPQTSGFTIWVSELIWRDFYIHIAYFYPDICRHKPFKSNTDNIPWRNDLKLFDAWKQGMTGFPLVDAGMRQLLQTGWMHNRLRMLTAMFLSKLLLIDWRLGEQHFMQHLIDGEFAANNGGWQWCASTGTDAVPYFRIFNPITQSQRFDPKGTFIRQFCPELAHLNDKQIHNPFALGVSPDALDYPEPIIDYKHSRQYAIECFKRLS